MILTLLLSAVSFEARVAALDARLALKRYEVWVSERSAWQRIILMNEARFGEGVIPERDLVQARVEGGLLDLGVSEAERELAISRARLLTLLGASPALEEGGEPNFPPLPPGEVGKGGEDAARDYESARQQIMTFRLRLLGQCEESASIEELLYEQLKTTLLSLIEARRTCREIRLRYAETLHRAETSRLRLRELLGREDFLS